MRRSTPFTADGLPRTLWWDDGAGVLRMIDQTRLPGECERADLRDAAKSGRGDPHAPGARRARDRRRGGLRAGARRARASATADDPAQRWLLNEIAAQLRATRPTAVNLAWALDRLLSRRRTH